MLGGENLIERNTKVLKSVCHYSEIKNVIGLWKLKNWIGFDEISIQILKSAKSHILNILSHFTNSLLYLESIQNQQDIKNNNYV